MKEEVLFHGIKSIDMLSRRAGGCTGSNRIIENLNPICLWSRVKASPLQAGWWEMTYYSPGLCPPTCMSSRKFGFSSIVVWCICYMCFLYGSLSGLNSVASLSLHSPQWLEGCGARAGQDWLAGVKSDNELRLRNRPTAQRRENGSKAR